MDVPIPEIPGALAGAQEDVEGALTSDQVAALKDHERPDLRYFVSPQAEIGSVALGVAFAGSNVHILRVEVVEPGVGRYSPKIDQYREVNGQPVQVYSRKEWGEAMAAIIGKQIPGDIPSLSSPSDQAPPPPGV